MNAVFYCKATDKVCAAIVRPVNGVFYIDRPTLLRLFKRLSCDDVNKISCDCLVYYSFPTLLRPYKEYKAFKVV